MTEQGSADQCGVVVTVVRTGGVAGMRREWRVAPRPDAAARWVRLVDGCPWGEPSDGDTGTDRFTWRLRACVGDRELTRTIPEQALRGPWRTLVDAVREYAAREDDA
ncbi:protealysin inhibitor emfourin [Microbacterium sp. GXF7504]